MTLSVGGLTPSVTEDSLWERFSKYGLVDSVQIVRDYFSGQSRRFGFIDMPLDDQAQKAIRAMNGADFQGMVLSVIAKRRHAAI